MAKEKSKEKQLISLQRRGVIYARYSAGPHQTEQSIEGQLRECRQYAERNGITIIREYIDRKISGTTDNREQFLLMMEDSKHHQFDVVITYKTDRFSRNRYDAAVYKRQLRLNGVEIAYSSESIPDGPEGIILESLLEGLAEYYSAELRQKIARGMHESALKCKALGHTIMGYRKGEDGRYEIEPREAEVVRMVFERYIDGEKLKDIAEVARSMGLQTKYGNPVSPRRLGDMVANERYTGVYISHGVRIEGGMPAIIDRETFLKAQRRREFFQNIQNRSTNAGQAYSKVDYLLSGKVFCGKCGSPMIGYGGTSHTGKVYTYYACKNRIKKRCSLKHVARDSLETRVAKITIQYILQPEVISTIIEGCIEAMNQSNQTATKQTQLKRALKQTQHEIDNVINAIASGFISESLKERLSQLERTKQRISLELAELKDIPEITEQQLRFLFSMAEKSKGEDASEYRKRLLNIFVFSVHVFDDKVVVTYNFADRTRKKRFSVNEYKHSSDWVHQVSMMLIGSAARKTCP